MGSNDLLEKDIEDAFIGYVMDNLHRYEIIGWQMELPLGILDVLLYSRENYAPMVVEIKRGNANEKAIAQLLCYTKQLEDLLHSFMRCYFGVSSQNNIVIVPAILAKGLSGKMANRAKNIGLIQFIQYEFDGEDISFIEHRRPQLRKWNPFEKTVIKPVFYEMMNDILIDQSYGRVFDTNTEINRTDFCNKMPFDIFEQLTKKMK